LYPFFCLEATLGLEPRNKAFAMMAAMKEAEKPLKNIHAKLRYKGIWIWTKGAIEEHLGLDGKNERCWTQFVERVKKGKIESFVPDYASIEELCKWIVEGSRQAF
jgi:hypothetical protein